MNETIVEKCRDMAIIMNNDGLSKAYIISVLYSKFGSELGITLIDSIVDDVRQGA